MARTNPAAPQRNYQFLRNKAQRVAERRRFYQTGRGAVISVHSTITSISEYPQRTLGILMIAAPRSLDVCMVAGPDGSCERPLLPNGIEFG
jgi:hypothetical protein